MTLHAADGVFPDGEVPDGPARLSRLLGRINPLIQRAVVTTETRQIEPRPTRSDTLNTPARHDGFSGCLKGAVPVPDIDETCAKVAKETALPLCIASSVGELDTLLERPNRSDKIGFLARC